MKEKNGSTGNSQLILIIVVLVVILGLAAYLLNQKKSVQEQIPSGQSSQQNQQEPVGEGQPLPEKDAVGTQDLDIIGRYPQSVRTMYENPPDMGYESVTYEAKASMDEVKEYYINQLQEDGWEIISSEEDEIRFQKEPESLFLRFYYDQNDKILRYTLEYFPESNY